MCLSISHHKISFGLSLCNVQNVKDFFVLAYELDVALSIWKFYKTPKFYKLMDVFDQMTETIMFYVDRAVARLDATSKLNNEAGDRSVLEKLLMIDRRIAIVMAFDMLFAGVDTVKFLFLLRLNFDAK